MDTLNTPDGDHPSSLGERQASQQSTTPLLNSIPSTTEDQISDNNNINEGTSGALNNNNESTPAQNGEHNANKINNGDRTIKVVIDSKDGRTLQNGAHTTVPGKDFGDDLNKRGTAIPIREEFRCQRFWFFYHDLRALTTSVSF